MKLLDKPLPRNEIEFLLNMVRGNISRICVSNSPVEIICQLGFATEYLSTIAYSRMKELNLYLIHNCASCKHGGYCSDYDDNLIDPACYEN